MLGCRGNTSRPLSELRAATDRPAAIAPEPAPAVGHAAGGDEPRERPVAEPPPLEPVTVAEPVTPPPSADPRTDPAADPRTDPPSSSPRDRADAASAPDGGLVAVFPGVMVDREARTVEVQGFISELVSQPVHGRVFYLEQFVCKQGTKDHESPVVTKAEPSNVHAALLLIGLEPGSPVTWNEAGEPSPPTGDAVRVSFVVNGRPISPWSWAIDRRSGLAAPVRGPAGPDGTTGRWVFAGSTEQSSRGRLFYEADAAGTLIGLASFGSETIAWSQPVSHEEAAGELRWIADEAAMPGPGEPVTIRISAGG